MCETALLVSFFHVCVCVCVFFCMYHHSSNEDRSFRTAAVDLICFLVSIGSDRSIALLLRPFPAVSRVNPFLVSCLLMFSG